MAISEQKLLRSPELYAKILLRNALIRTTLKYALFTQEDKQIGINILEQFAPKCIRHIVGPKWFLEEENRRGDSSIKNARNQQYDTG